MKSVNGGPNIATDGLIFYFDAGNRNSYISGSSTLYSLNNEYYGNLESGLIFENNTIESIGFNATASVSCSAIPEIGSSLTGLTVEVIAKPKRYATGIILENGSWYDRNTFFLAQENGTYFSFLVADEDGWNFRVANYEYSTDRWYHLVGWWNTGLECKFYTNGEETSGASGGSVRTVLRDGDTNLEFGRRPVGGEFPFSGSIALVRIYNRGLTPSEIQQNYNTLKGRFSLI